MPIKETFINSDQPGATQVKKLSIFAPIGGFGNHLRWLLLLSPEFNITVGIPRELYWSIAKPDWPMYTEYISDQFKPWELLQNDPDYIKFCKKISESDPNKKTEFIEEQIYNNERNFQNWLSYEWIYRENLNSVIVFDHRLKNINMCQKNIIITADPELALRSYIKFNSSLNSGTIKQFKRLVEQFNNDANELSSCQDTLIISAEELAPKMLHGDLYNQIINFADISNCYSYAQKIHSKWFDLHKRAEKEIVTYFQNLYQINQ